MLVLWLENKPKSESTTSKNYPEEHCKRKRLGPCILESSTLNATYLAYLAPKDPSLPPPPATQPDEILTRVP